MREALEWRNRSRKWSKITVMSTLSALLFTGAAIDEAVTFGAGEHVGPQRLAVMSVVMIVLGALALYADGRATYCIKQARQAWEAWEARDGVQQ